MCICCNVSLCGFGSGYGDVYAVGPCPGNVTGQLYWLTSVLRLTALTLCLHSAPIAH
jgi:hypothetical protein